MLELTYGAVPFAQYFKGMSNLRLSARVSLALSFSTVRK